MTHLSPEELIDAVEGMLIPGRRAHLDTCQACRAEVSSLHALIEDARVSDVPEPSPLFWDHFSARVKAAIANDSDETPRSARWFEWPVFAPLVTLALLVIALVSVVPLGEEVSLREDAPVVGTELAASEDALASHEAEWTFLADLVSDLDVDAVPDDSIFTRPGSADAAVFGLSSAEQEELLRLLREELRAGG